MLPLPTKVNVLGENEQTCKDSSQDQDKDKDPQGPTPSHVRTTEDHKLLNNLNSHTNTHRNTDGEEGTEKS